MIENGEKRNVDLMKVLNFFRLSTENKLKALTLIEDKFLSCRSAMCQKEIEETIHKIGKFRKKFSQG